MTSNEMELEFHKFQKQSSFLCSKERSKQNYHTSKQGQSNTLNKKSALFDFKEQKIKFRFPLMDENNINYKSIQQEIVEQYPQIKVPNQQTSDKINSIEMEEDNKENINEILIEPPLCEVNKIAISTQTDFFKQLNQHISSKLYQQQF